MSQLKYLDQIEDNILNRSLIDEYNKVLLDAINKCRELEAGKKNSGLTPEQDSFMVSCTNASYKLTKQGLVNVSGNFSCQGRGISDFKGIKFGTIKGNFNVKSNNFSSLEGFPKKVGGDLNLSKNKFESLKGCPEYKGIGYFSSNPLRDADIVTNGYSAYFENCSVVSGLTLLFIQRFMRLKKISYSEAISCLEPYIKKGIDDEVCEKMIKSRIYSGDKWKEDDWYNLNKEDLNQELGKGSRLLYRFDD